MERLYAIIPPPAPPLSSPTPPSTEPPPPPTTDPSTGPQPAATTEPSTEATTAPPTIAQTSNKYVSLFRIDGVPILPPLMTVEKRRQMQKLKEKALKVEVNLKEKRRRRLHFRENIAEIIGASDNEPEDNTPRSQHSSFDSDVKRHQEELELEESYLLLTDLMRHGSEGTDLSDHELPLKLQYTETSTTAMLCNEPIVHGFNAEDKLVDRMQKLGKSETIIYDNQANVIIMPMSQQKEWRLQDDTLRTVEEQANLSVAMEQKSIHFLAKEIPSIYVDPPTPVATDGRSLCSSDTNMGINLLIDGNVEDKQFQYYANRYNCPVMNISAKDVGSDASVVINNVTSDSNLAIKDVASDASFVMKDVRSNASFVIKDVRSDASFLITSPRFYHGPQELQASGTQLLPFEQSPRSERSTKKLLEPDINPPQRSATSPQLKLLTPKSSPMNTQDDVSASENGIVRSNSFTIDCPSKALLDHMRRQKTALLGPTPSETSQRRCGPSASAIRDTVESKAKRVQKVELKARTPPKRRQLKFASSHSNCGANMSSPYLASAAVSFKNKRSPYDNQSISKPKLTRQPKKLPSTIMQPSKLMRAKPTMLTFCSADTKLSSPNHDNGKRAEPISSQDAFVNELETEQRQRLLKLIAQQHDEQRRLQASFEAQKQQLLDQLSVEKCKVLLLQCSGDAGVTYDLNSATAAAGGGSGGGGGGCMSSVESSPNPKSECSSERTQRSPTLTSFGGTSSAAQSARNCKNNINNNNNLELLESDCSCSTLTTGAANSRCTPRRRLFAGEDHFGTPRNANGQRIGGAVEANARGGGGCTPSRGERSAAATIINAHARGFLVRRLFQTEQIQRIVQTIRDTLIFVLNLHMETLENPAEANTTPNIKLKARLLQQLSSATRTLHLVFFQTTMRERMEIIARDRKRIKTKLLTMNLKRSPHFVA